MKNAPQNAPWKIAGESAPQKAPTKESVVRQVFERISELCMVPNACRFCGWDHSDEAHGLYATEPCEAALARDKADRAWANRRLYKAQARRVAAA